MASNVKECLEELLGLEGALGAALLARDLAQNA